MIRKSVDVYLLSQSPTKKLLLLAHSEKKVGVGGRFQPKSPPTRWSTAKTTCSRAPMKKREAREVILVEPICDDFVFGMRRRIEGWLALYRSEFGCGNG